MPARALLVLLVMLNLGVGLWWLLRPDPVPSPPWVPPAGVPRLQLLGEAGPARPLPVDPPAAQAVDGEDGANAPDLAAAPDAQDGDGAPGPLEASPRASGAACFSFGPFPGAAAADAPRAVLQAQGATRVRLRDEAPARARRWSVVIAPQPDRAAADALAARIRAAGFDDLQVLATGDDANGIALGVFSSESAARRRESALNDAGFAARARPLDAGGTRYWLDVSAGPGFDAASARGAAGASQVRPADCAGIVAAGSAG